LYIVSESGRRYMLKFLRERYWEMRSSINVWLKTPQAYSGLGIGRRS